MLLKRLFDVFIAFTLWIALSPLFLLVAILIMLFVPGPVFFKQKRVGQGGELFTMVKFRTMLVGHAGSTVTVKGQERITPLGAVLRKYKLDELPELWNILKGDMSFVGPRPDVPGYADKLEGENRLILRLKPGLTGPASLKYAREEEILAAAGDPQKYNDEVIWPDKVKINLDYYHKRSFYEDLLIILRTVFG